MTTTCIADEGCDTPAIARRLCTKHYQQAKAGRIPLPALLDGRPFRACQEEGCGGRHEARGLCRSHYRAGVAAGKFPEVGGKCSVAGCDRPVNARGWCGLHYKRWKASGDPVVIRGRTDWSTQPRGSNSPHWLDTPTYQAAHQRVKRERGAASGFFCVEQGCSSRAAHWAYNGDDPNELLGKSRKGGKSWYSANVDAYEPMCAKCHATKDKAAASAELTEYRELKHDSGLTGSEIRELVEQYRNSSQKAVA